MNKLARHEAAERAWKDYYEEMGDIVLRLSTKEVADLVIIHPSGFCTFVEVKTGTGRLSKPEKRFRDQCKARSVSWFEERGFPPTPP